MTATSTATSSGDASRVRLGRSPAAGYFTAFLVLGMGLSVAGPALPHLREQAGVGIGSSGFVLAGQSFGYIIGSLAAGRPYDRGAGHRLLVGAALVVFAAVFTSTFVSDLWLVVVMFAVIGLAGAALDVGANTLLVWSQPPERVGSRLNALHLCFGIGALATPVVVSLSFDWSDDLTAVAVVIAAGVAVMAAVLHGTTEPVRREAAHHDEVDAPHLSPAFVLLCLFFFLYVGAEVTFAGWLTTYGDELDLGDAAAGLLASVFWAGFVLGRVVAIDLTRRISLPVALIGSCTLATAATFVLAIGDGVTAVVWGATAVIGFALGPQYATMLAFGDQRLRLSGSSTSLLIASSGVGGLLLPIATGWVLDTWGATYLPWAVCLAGALTTAVAVAVVEVGQRPPLTSRNAPVT